jgi:hypothetical protein
LLQALVASSAVKSLPVFAIALLLAAVAPLLRINPSACALCCVGTVTTAACLQAAVATLGSQLLRARSPICCFVNTVRAMQ